MKTFARNLCIVTAILLLALAAPATAGPISYSVTINTSSISGGSYFIDVQLNPGDQSSQALTAVVGSFNLGTGSLAGSPSVIGDVTGTLPGSLTLVNSTFFNDYYEGFTAGMGIFFNLTLSGPAIDSPNGTATGGSSFGISLFDGDNNPVLTVDPGGLLGRIDLGLDGKPTLIVSPASPAGGPAVTFTPETLPASVPEPATFELLGSAGLSPILFT